MSIFSGEPARLYVHKNPKKIKESGQIVLGDDMNKTNDRLMAYQETYGMTLQQARIYALYLDGHTVKQIADRMGIMPQHARKTLHKTLDKVALTEMV